MPRSDGFEVLRVLDRAGNRVAAVVLTGSESELDYVQVVKLGGRGLVLKSDGPQKLFAAIRTVAAGELAFSEQLAQQVLSTMSSENKGTAHALARLSGREREIAEHVTRGMKNKSIAQSLNISENTVKRHLQSIFTKTGARDRLELAVIALSDFKKAAWGGLFSGARGHLPHPGNDPVAINVVPGGRETAGVVPETGLRLPLSAG